VQLWRCADPAGQGAVPLPTLLAFLFPSRGGGGGGGGGGAGSAVAVVAGGANGSAGWDEVCGFVNTHGLTFCILDIHT
jgi:hypothetical protein